MKRLLVVVIALIILGGLNLTYFRTGVSSAPIPSPAEPKTVPPSNSSAGGGPLVRFDPSEKIRATEAAQSPLAQGQWARESELKAQGNATPVAAFETLMHAATGGDVKATAAALFLTDDARGRAEKLLATIPPEQRAGYTTAEECVAFLYIGASGVMRPRTGEVSYQFLADHAGIGIPPLALGLEESSASDPAYRTIKSKARSPGGKESDPVAVFRQTRDGWKWVVPPSTIDALGRLLKNGAPPPPPK